MAEHFRDEEHSEVAFVGAPDGLEARLADEAGIEFFAVPAKGYDRARPLTVLAAGWTAFTSLFRCLGLLQRYRADAVIGFGGYVSVPMGMAAVLGGVPLILHEQNAKAGLANRVLSTWAQAVCVTYPAAIPALTHPQRVHVTGDPVRPSVAARTRDASRASLKLAKKDVALLIFGGSRGARHLNAAMLNLYTRLKDVPNLKVLHIAGPLEVESVTAALKEVAGARQRKWVVYDYVEDMGSMLAACDLAVCRAGATTLAELALLAVPSVLVPYPYATDDHQTANAAALREAGAAVVFADAEIDGDEFAGEVVRLLGDAEARRAMSEAAATLARPHAAHAVVEVTQAVVCRRLGRESEADLEAGS